MSRLGFIKSKLDFTDRVVLDLGCSGGFFAFEISKIARKVIAVDGDPEIIERNKSVQNELRRENIDFVCAPISAETISNIGTVDITLFLSVFHHMLTVSDAYDWNRGVNSAHIDSMLTAVNRCTSTLVFETGVATEGYEWCARLPRLSCPLETFVINDVFRGAYATVAVYQSPVPVNWVNKYVISRLGRPYEEDSRTISYLKRFFRFDSRDLRKIYIGSKSYKPCA